MAAEVDAEEEAEAEMAAEVDAEVDGDLARRENERRKRLFPLVLFFSCFHSPVLHLSSAIAKYIGRTLTLMIIFSRHILLFIIA